ncbi:Ig-like domain-containing protein [Clostridium sp. MSJ-4]|uniref:Ig-like domain-containing protein n=1 Tax=Clostridium simiarum TaxID=2841506 RepID=A0ABS6EZ45_9CLOT|nr:Ig-like domain-containing protein [Clostridium simiarum]MBU5591005.1 Ig-like domain-containing protein [Clostridium simiarum]
MKKKFSLFLVFVLALLTWVGGINPQEANATVIDHEIGTKNLNNTPENSAKIGEQILQPEIGWRRYDDANSNITKGGNADTYSYYPAYKNMLTRLNTAGAYVEFNFTGTKLRVIGTRYSGYCKTVKILIDNVPYTFSSGGNELWQCLLFEINGLEDSEHFVKIIREVPYINYNDQIHIDAFDIDTNGQLKPYNEDTSSIVPTAEISVNKTSMDLLEGSSEKLTATVLPEDAINKKIIWTSSDSSIATIDENGNVTAVKGGQAVITATVEGTTLTATCNVTVTPISKDETITVESEQSKLRVGQEFTTDIVLHNGINICAEDIKIDYNKDLFEYVGYDVINGLRVVKELKDSNTGTLRFIIASLGKDNAINGDKIILKLKFKAKAVGTGKVDVVRARIADNGTMEKDLLSENCGEKEFIVSTYDVNRDGEFTLLDLGIDAWYYGYNAENTDTSKYDTDVVINGKVDDADLLEIVEQMIKNPNYEPNN